MKFSITKIDSATNPGAPTKTNEDHTVQFDDLYIVLDGATGLGEQVISTHASDAVWFVEKFSDYLIDFWKQDRRFIPAAASAIDSCIAEYQRHIGQKFRPEYEMPSAGMTAVAIEDGDINVYRLGDCVAYYQGGELANSLFDCSPLEVLDNRSIDALMAEIAKGSNINQARQKILPLLRKHRSLMNKPSGYGVLTLDQGCLRYMESLILTPNQNDLILLASDGFSAITKYKNCDIKEIFDMCESVTLKGVINEIRVIENNDLELTDHPRLKSHDDATALLLGISNG